MKIYFSFLFLIQYFYEHDANEIGKFAHNNNGNVANIFDDVNLGKVLGDSLDTNADNIYGKIFKNNEVKRSHYKFDFDAGNPDIHGEMIRPCQVYDTFCIRKFFAEHSHCKTSGKAVPEPLSRAQSNFNYPHVNMSLSQITADYSGINNGKIVEFYINKVTDNLVIAFDFDAVSKFSNNTIVKYYLKGREPIVTNDFTGITYLQLTITVIIPHLENLRLDKAEIYTYANNPVFPFEVGPRLAVSSDPEVPTMFAAFLATIRVAYIEELFNQGVYFASNFLQYNICDFGIKVL